MIKRWMDCERGRYWSYGKKSVEAIRDEFAERSGSTHERDYIGLIGRAPTFLVETYDPAQSLLCEHVTCKDGDIGIHFFVKDPATPISGLTFAVMSAILTFAFSIREAQRVVIEPDIRNLKAQTLAKKVGFSGDHIVDLGYKTAVILVCAREDFALSRLGA